VAPAPDAPLPLGTTACAVVRSIAASGTNTHCPLLTAGAAVWAAAAGGSVTTTQAARRAATTRALGSTERITHLHANPVRFTSLCRADGEDTRPRKTLNRVGVSCMVQVRLRTLAKMSVIA
jgi:hypothetical protein